MRPEHMDRRTIHISVVLLITYSLLSATAAHGSAADGSTSAFTISMAAAPRNGEEPLAVEFSVAIVGGEAPFDIHWQFGDGGSSGLQDPEHTYRSGRYRPQVTVTDAAGVVRKQEQVITVHGDGENPHEQLAIQGIRIDGAVDAIVDAGDVLEVDLRIAYLGGERPDRLSLRATLFGDGGALAVGQNVLLTPFRRGRTTSPRIVLAVPLGTPPGTYDLRITMTADDGTTRTRHREVVVR